MITKCSLCEQSFSVNDPMLSVRKKRHEEHHSRRNLSKNNIVGKVEWELLK